MTCSESKLCDPNHKHGHVVTGDLNIITNAKLRSLLTKGPSYREAERVDWKRNFHSILNGITDCISKWCAKENVDTSVMFEWKSRVLHEVRVRIDSLKSKNRKHRKKVLDDKIVRNYLKSFHDKYVITPTDKAGNNFSIVCKKFYIECSMNELDLLPDSQSKSTYKCLNSKPSIIVTCEIHERTRYWTG